MKTDKLHRGRWVKSSLKQGRIAGLRAVCRRVAVGLAVFSLALVLLGPAWAWDGDLDPNFNPGVGAQSVPMLWGQINYNDGSGNMMITGSFTTMGGYNRSGVARVNSDGSLDPSFNAAITGYVNGCILLTPDSSSSKMLICGDFVIPSTDPLKDPYYGLALLDQYGNVDDSFPHVFSTGDGVQSMGRQADGKIMVGGYAMKVNNHPDFAYYLVRIDSMTGVVPTYMLSAPGGNVNGLWVDQGAAGQVRLFGTIPRFTDPTHVDHMVVLSADGTSRVGGIGDEVVNGTILGMTWQGSNTVIFGSFTQVTQGTVTTPMKGIARFLPGMVLDTAFNIGTGANGHVKRAVNDGDKLVLSGYFNSFNGTDCGYLVRLDNTGSVDGTFNAGGSGADDRVWNINKQSDGTWVALGAFKSFNGSPRQCLATLDADGDLTDRYPLFTTSYLAPTPPKVYAIQDSPQGLYIAGTLSGYGGKLHRRVARVNFDGTPDASFRGGMGGVVYSLSRQEDGKLLVAGHFGVGTGYVGCTSLARLNLDGTMDLTFKPVLTKEDGSLPNLYMVDTLDDGKIIIAGDFAKIADADRVMQVRSGFARLNPDGSLDHTFTVQINIPGVTEIVVRGAGKMNGRYPIAGSVKYNGDTVGFYTRLTSTGDLDPTFGPPGGPAPHVNLFNGEVKCGTDTADGRVLVGGDFTQVHDGQGFNIPRSYIARFTVDGLLDTTFAGNPGANNSIYVMERQWPNSRILIGGAFTAYNGAVRNYIARINPDGSLDNGFNPGTGPNGAVYAIQHNNYIQKARIGGAFTTYKDISRPGVAQISANSGSFDPALFLLIIDSPATIIR